jgi:hypothetical protein
VADHQIRYTTSDSSDSKTTNPTPDLPEESEWATDDPIPCMMAGGDMRPRGNVPEPDWDAMNMALANLPEAPW